MWSSGFTADWRLADGEEVVSLTLLLDGDLSAETEDGIVPLQVGAAWVWTGSRDIVWSGRSAAVIQIEVDGARLSGFLDIARIEGKPFVASRSLRDPFVALVMSVLDSEISPSRSSFMQIQRALEAMTTAILVEEAGLPTYHGRSVAGRALFQRATAFIASNAGDPTLTLDSIAEALNVSTPHLIRVFQSSETTPIRYLRNIRAMNAISMLESSTQVDDIEAIARLTGFSSARNMRRAINEFSPRHVPTHDAIESLGMRQPRSPRPHGGLPSKKASSNSWSPGVPETAA
ncbi:MULTISPECIES: helix-turn-helix domain-containing protein [Bacteria]|uniref:helix-turn-helix domain-containing protein n=1 Tax=Bacteria TaxID=2 RepID=UPI003C7CE124